MKKIISLLLLTVTLSNFVLAQEKVSTEGYTTTLEDCMVTKNRACSTNNFASSNASTIIECFDVTQYSDDTSLEEIICTLRAQEDLATRMTDAISHSDLYAANQLVKAFVAEATDDITSKLT